MKKNVTIMATTPTWNINMQNIVNSLKTPAERLRLFYENALERKISMRQMGLLVNAQAAFFMAFMPVESPWLVRVACLAWLASALLKCKRAL